MTEIVGVAVEAKNEPGTVATGMEAEELAVEANSTVDAIALGDSEVLVSAPRDEEKYVET